MRLERRHITRTEILAAVDSYEIVEAYPEHKYLPSYLVLAADSFHVPAWISAAHASPILIASVILLNGAAGVLLGWIYWRGGLPYAILAHFAGDMIVQSFGPRLLAG